MPSAVRITLASTGAHVYGRFMSALHTATPTLAVRALSFALALVVVAAVAVGALLALDY